MKKFPSQSPAPEGWMFEEGSLIIIHVYARRVTRLVTEPRCIGANS